MNEIGTNLFYIICFEERKKKKQQSHTKKMYMKKINKIRSGQIKKPQS